MIARLRTEQERLWAVEARADKAPRTGRITPNVLATLAPEYLRAARLLAQPQPASSA